VRFVKPLLFVAGAVLLAVLIHRVGAEPILATLRALAWWQFVLVCLPYGGIVAVDTLGWRFAFTRDRAPFWRLYGARLAGEALNVVTAVGSVGGEAVKAWLVRRDVSYAESVPAIVIAKTTIVIAQAIFLLVGIVLAWTALDVSGGVLRAMLWLLVIEVFAVGGFFGAQVSGLVGRAGRLLVWAGVTADAAAAESLDASLRHYYRHEWRRFAASTGFHTLGWLIGGALEATLVLWVLGITTSVATASVIEALGSGVRFASFMVPAGLGAFEGANAAAFGALGFGAAAGLAFSVVRRARQIVWIVVGLLVLLGMRLSER
jgi:glycosyltransferase 2 family protein